MKVDMFYVTWELCFGGVFAEDNGKQKDEFYRKQLLFSFKWQQDVNTYKENLKKFITF